MYGRAESDSPWLKVSTPGVSGQVQAQVGFEIDTRLMDEDRIYLGTLKVIANAGQSFTVRVKADVQGNRKGWFSGRPRRRGRTAARPAMSRPPRRRCPAGGRGGPPPPPRPMGGSVPPPLQAGRRD